MITKKYHYSIDLHWFRNSLKPVGMRQYIPLILTTCYLSCSSQTTTQETMPEPTEQSTKIVHHMHPDWSPDGTQIVFDSDLDGDRDIYVINIDGSGFKQISDNEFNNMMPRWSGDGSKILFTSDRDGNSNIFVMNADGTGKKRLTFHPAEDLQGAWSDDDSKIVFVSDRAGPYRVATSRDVYIMDARGGNYVRITNDQFFDSHPGFIPGSDDVSYISLRDGQSALYRMGQRGSGETQIITAEKLVTGYSWSRDGSKIAYRIGSDLEQELMLLDTGDNNTITVFNALKGNAGISWSQDHTKLAVQHSDHIESGSDIWIIPIHEGEMKRITGKKTR